MTDSPDPFLSEDNTQNVTPEDAEKIAVIFSRLATPRRILILTTLLEAEQPLASSVIAAVTGQTEAACSFNLVRLAEVGLIHPIRSGRCTFYVPDRDVLNTITGVLNGKATRPKTEEVS